MHTLKILFYLILVIIIESGFPKNAFSYQASEAGRKPLIAILAFEGKNISEEEASILTDRIRTHLQEIGEYDVLVRDRMEKLAEEWKLKQSGILTTNDAIKIGEVLGAEYLVMGMIGKIGKTFSITASMIDVETSQIIGSSNRKFLGQIDDLLEYIQTVGYDLSGMKELSNLLESAVGEYSVYSALGFTYYKSGRFIAALQAFKKADELKILDDETLLWIGNTYLNLEDYKRAIQSYQSVIIISPNNADAHHGLGSAYMLSEEMDEAIKSYRKAISLKPDNDEHQYALGWALARIERYKESAKYLENAIKINPESYGGQMMLGEIYRKLGKLENAKISFEKATEIRPDIAVGYQYLGFLYSFMGRLDKAKKAANKAIELEPENYRSHLSLGYIHYRNGDHINSILAYETAINLLSETTEEKNKIYHILGAIEYLKGNYTKSIEYYKNVLEIDKGSGGAKFGLALSQLASGNLEKAKKNYQEAIATSDEFEKIEAKQDLKMLIARGIMVYKATLVLTNDFRDVD